MFLDNGAYQRIAWNMAAVKGQVEVLHKIWDWAKEVLTQEELKTCS